MRRLVFLGTGSAMVTHCYNTCFLLESSEGEFFLTDAGGGNGILRQLEEIDFDYAKLHYMFVTHAHTDHILGVVWLMRKIATLIEKGKYSGNFTIYCHDVVADFLHVMAKALLKKKDYEKIGTRIIIQEIIDGESVGFLGWKLTAFDIFSKKAKQYGYRLQNAQGFTLTCLGDEPFNEHDRQYAEGADWLLSEAFCRYEDREHFKPYEKNHSTVKEAAELAEMLQAKNLVLYHTEEETLSVRKATYTDEAQKYYRGKVFVPDDLEEIKLK